GFASASMGRSASRGSGTLLLRPRPPAMTSPPAMKTAEPSRGYSGRQGTAGRVAHPGLVVPLLVARHERKPASESVYDEVAPRDIDAAVHQCRQQDEQSEHEGSPSAHREPPPSCCRRRNWSMLV